MREIKRIVIHCTDSPDDLDIGFKQINEWHQERGFLSESGISCGYHYIVRRDGRVEKGRPDAEIGAHVKGHNQDTLGIVWVGKKDPSNVQYKAMIDLVTAVRTKYGLSVERVVGHRECDPGSGKTCPNLNMLRFRGDLLFRKIQEISRDFKKLVG